MQVGSIRNRFSVPQKTEATTTHPTRKIIRPHCYQGNGICNLKTPRNEVSRPREFHWRNLPNGKNHTRSRQSLPEAEEEGTRLSSFSKRSSCSDAETRWREYNTKPPAVPLVKTDAAPVHTQPVRQRLQQLFPWWSRAGDNPGGLGRMLKQTVVRPRHGTWPATRK